MQSSLAQGLIERFDPIDSWGQDNDFYALYNKVFGTDINVVIDNVKPIHTTKSEVEGLDDMSIGNHPECDI